jgi:hypothetical protein
MQKFGQKLFKNHKLGYLQNLGEVAGLGAAVLLGGAMIVALLTASGH